MFPKEIALGLPRFSSQRGRKFPMPQTGLEGVRVLALESRRAKEIASLLRNNGAEPMVAPALREISLESNTAALDFAAALMQGEFDLVIFLTGAGVRALLATVETKYDREAFLQALRRVKVAARGPKPIAVLRELNVPITVTAPEPNTWRELIASIEAEIGPTLENLRVAVQEYGAPATDLLAALRERHARTTAVPVYQWALPEDLEPLRAAILAIAERKVDLLFLLNAAQVTNLFHVAGQMGKQAELSEGLRSTVVCSIGPTTSEQLRQVGIEPDFEPAHPKMGFMVNEAAKVARTLIDRKRSA
jgi:uroporphyrinogen-III synthase